MFSETIRLDPVRRPERELRIIGDLVSRLWNAGNYRCRQAFLAKEGVPTGFTLEAVMKETPEYRQLPSDIAQEVLKKLSEAWRSYFALRTKWQANPAESQRPGLPAYRKDKRTGERPFDYIPFKTSRSYSLDAKDVHLVLPRDRRPNGRSGRLHIAYRGRLRFDGQRGRAEIQCDRVRRRWSMRISVKAETAKPVADGRGAAVDLGVRISASVSIEGVAQALHFEGREALKDWDFLGREIAREQACIAHSRGKADDTWRAPSSRQISRLYRKRKGRLRHAMLCMAKAIAETCRAEGVSHVFLGWPKDILRDVKYGSSEWAGRIHSFWSFDQALDLIENALTKVGSTSERVGERGSSSTCPSCGSQHVSRSPRWRLRCRDCAESIHSDQAGSRNILKFQTPSISWAGAEAAPRTVTQRWSRHRWDRRSANPRRMARSHPEFLAA
jgi:transposase